MNAMLRQKMNSIEVQSYDTRYITYPGFTIPAKNIIISAWKKWQSAEHDEAANILTSHYSIPNVHVDFVDFQTRTRWFHPRLSSFRLQDFVIR